MFILLKLGNWVTLKIFFSHILILNILLFKESAISKENLIVFIFVFVKKINVF